MNHKVLLLFDNNGREYVARITAAARQYAAAHRLQLVHENVFETRRGVLDALMAHQFDGLMLTPPVSDDRDVLFEVSKRNTPTVRIAPLLDLSRNDLVTMDEFDASRSIVDHLIEKGHKRIGFIRGPRTHLVSIRRYNGYAAAVGKISSRIDPSLVTEGDFSRQSGRDVAPKLFAAKPTAIFASNDEMAAGVIDAAGEAGLSVPRDLSVVGFDDNAVAKSVRPGLTTVRQPLEEMTEQACRLLAERLRNPARQNDQVDVPFEIMERGSVQAI